MKGYVYVLTNEAMPGLVKIGRSVSAAAGRANAIYSGDTGVPLPFDIYFECLFDDCVGAEREVHDQLKNVRINPKREFFRMPADEAAIAVMRVKACEFDHVIEYSELVTDPGYMHGIAEDLGCHVFELIAAINSSNPDEMRPILRRYLENREKRRAMFAERVHVVVDNTDGAGVAANA